MQNPRSWEPSNCSSAVIGSEKSGSVAPAVVFFVRPSLADILAGRRTIGAGALLLLATQQVPAQFGREPGILVRATDGTVMGRSGRRAALGF